MLYEVITHIIYVVHAGNAREGDTANLSAVDLIDVVTGCKERNNFV